MLGIDLGRGNLKIEKELHRTESVITEHFFAVVEVPYAVGIIAGT